MGSWIIRIFLFGICGVSGYYLAREYFPSPQSSFFGLFFGIILAFLAILTERSIKRIPLKSLIGGFVGLILGLFAANLSSNVFLSNPLENQRLLPIYGLIYGFCGYIGLKVGYRKGEEFNLSSFKIFSKNSKRDGSAKILDTSVIIDGRISDITETGFIEGAIIIPQFVLNELQHIADSSDPVKRTRGRRGLEVLQHIQKQINVDVRIVDRDYPNVKEVDSKLIELAKEVGGKIITNDSNLNKVAELQGIEVLNINALANALKPVVLPGEEINVKILKEGKEIGQGVAYLDDGTMIVIDNGKRLIGKNVDVVVTSVLQTPAGRMIFARLKDESSRDNRGRDYYYPIDSEF